MSTDQPEKPQSESEVESGELAQAAVDRDSAVAEDQTDSGSEAGGSEGEAGPGDDSGIDEQTPAPLATAGRGSRALAALALLVAALSAAAAGFLWWQYRQFYVDLDAADARTEAALTRARAEMVTLEDALGVLGDRDNGLQQDLERLGGDVDRIAPRLLEYEERLQAIQGVSYDARRIWLTAEARYLLTVANNELQLAGRWSNARLAMDLADEKLRELANPALTPVREEIAAAVQAMAAVEVPDVEGMSLSLGNLEKRVLELPLKSEDMANFAPQRTPDETPPGLERAWASLKAAIAGMVRIDRRDEPVQRTLTARESELVRWGTQLELVAARLALLRGDQQNFEQAVETASDNLRNFFDGRDPTVSSALQVLADMQAVKVDPPRPDISAPLNTLRRLTAGDQGTGQ